MRHFLYLTYGVLLLGLLGVAAMGGIPLSGTHINEVKNVPKSVRENPGVYRSIYGGYSHYVGGK